MAQEKEYYAFISYKREDETWAKWLQNKLEHYRFPTNLSSHTNLPKSIRPTFRDVTDLNPGLLAEEINNALHNSEWLIVVCSPRSAKSPWVCKEAQAFIDLVRADHIIPFVIEGNPFSKDVATECYPEALLNLTGSKELLAANVNEMGRDAAAIKVVARMFNLRFDTLWQRYEREQRKKRWMWIAGAILFALLGLGIGSYFLKQNNIIESQNEQLREYVSNLKEANNTFSLLNNAQKQYTLAGELRGNGCQDLSLMFFDYHPYEPIVAFSDDWGFWLHYLNSGVEILLPTGNIIEPVYNITALCFSEDGTELMAEGHTGVFVWNVNSQKLIEYYEPFDGSKYIESHEFQRKFPYYSLRTDGIIYNDLLIDSIFDCKIECNNGLLNIIDKKNNKSICSTTLEKGEDPTYSSLFNYKNKEILFITNKKAALYDDVKKDFVLFFKDYNNANDIEFSYSGEYLRVGKNIYERTFSVDTIQNLCYETYPIGKFPHFSEEKNYQYDETTNASLEVGEQIIKYRRGSFVKEIEVLKKYSMGNMQESLSDALFAGSNKIVAIVEQGRFRIYNTGTWDLIGTLDNFVWTSYMCMGHEEDLSHPDSYIVFAKYIDRKLYVISSGGILRIYNIDKIRLEKVIELPIEWKEYGFVGPLDKLYLADDASRIYYSFEYQPFYYVCELPYIQ